jgi:hypothetical protein
MAVVLVAGATPRGLPLAVRLDPEASARQLALEALEAVAEVSRAAALEDEVAVAVVSVETEALAAAEVVDSVAVVEEEEEEDLVVAEAVLDTSPTATVPLTALPPVPVVLGKAASVADVVDSEVIVVQARLAVTETIDEAEEVVVVGMIGGPAAQTTSLWAAETDQNARAMAVERVGTAETMAHGNVGMKATATTIRDNEGGTDLLRWLKRASVRVCQGYLPFFRLILSRQWG